MKSIRKRLTQAFRNVCGARVRGAAMAEAVIVIPVLTIGFYGLLFFREHYLGRIETARLARAAVVAHGLSACRGAAAKDWLGPDLAHYTAGLLNRDPAVAQGASVDESYLPGDSSARDLMANKDGMAPDGKGILNPIFDTWLSGTVTLSNKSRNPFRAPRTNFKSIVQSRSFVSCGDPVRDGNYDQVLSVIKDEASNLIGRKR